MRAWSAVDVPRLTSQGPRVRLFDTATGAVQDAGPEQGTARLYVCGITPYDATHMGHAATFVAFDLLNRAWRNAGLSVRYVQNVTDIDDPLLERAAKVGTPWEEIAERETQLLREDLEALRVLPPDHFVGAVESIPLVLELIDVLRQRGAVVDIEGDLYFRVASDPGFGRVSGLPRADMLRIFGERGGDPERPGKEDPLDCLLWMRQRDGEPAWPSPYGPGRPGWHIECTAIAEHYLGDIFDIQGGGSDLVFPHHEMCASEAQVARNMPFAAGYAHAGMVGLDGEKMSKSKGNLVFVSHLRRAEVDPMAVRLVLLHHHYRSDWEWTDAQLYDAVETMQRWRGVLGGGVSAAGIAALVHEVLAALADDLDAPRAVAALDAWLSSSAPDPSPQGRQASEQIRALADAALGVAL